MPSVESSRQLSAGEMPRRGRDIRVVLVYPSSHGSVQTLYTFNKNQRIGNKPPQSLMILATYLREQGFPNVHCLDAQVEDISPAETARRVAEMYPDVVGITAWTDFWYPTWETLNELRRLLPHATLIIGGPHVSVFPEESLEASTADFAVAGDGEDILLQMVQDISSGRPVRDGMPGVWGRAPEGRIVKPSVPIAMVKDITAIPPPDRTLLPYRQYSSVLTPSDYETTMVTSRGCPYKCVFCKMDVQKVYARSAEQVVEEFRQIEALGISDVQVYDDTFTWGQARAIDICDGIIKQGIKVNWAIRDRVNRVTPELYQKLREAGCYRVHFGVETGSPQILKNSGKFMTLEQVHRGVALAKESGMKVMTYFMFGFLDETYEDAMMTVDLAKTLDTDYVSFGVLIPYPGTEIYRESLKRGIVPRDYWREFTRNPVPDYRIPHVIEDKLSRETLIALKNSATRNFYFRPSRLLREAMNTGSFSDFVKKARLGAHIFLEGLNPLSVNRY